MTVLIEKALPTQFNPFHHANLQSCFSGSVALAELSRLHDVLQSHDGDLQISLQAGVDREGICFLRGNIQTRIYLNCQRCGEPVIYDLQTNFLLSPVRNDQQAKQLPHLYEPLLVTSEEMVDVKAMIEEEILLQLPMVARHPRGECPVSLPNYLH